ncbi:MAG TPA: selenium-binding protein SBP56-related protein, partial [Acidimicrobiales bacterium]|nr:selenium-binding protein SBP56-related protein [Acidimicrobiales bacterium]
MADPTFYRSPSEAAAADAERLAYVATLDTSEEGKPDAIVVLDTDPGSASYGQVVGRLDFPNVGDELHHFGWNACSSCLAHEAHGHHHSAERRYLVVPGLRSSRIYIVDTKPDPRKPTLVKTIEADELAARTGYSRPHTSHCGPDGIYMSALGAADGNGPGGIFVIDPESFEIRGAWEQYRGPQHLAYDFWWHLNHNTLVSSEWGTPNMVEGGLDPSLIGQFGHQLHFWDLAGGKHLQTVDLGAEQQMVLELRPSHNPDQTYGFVGVVVSTKDLSASIWTWYQDKGSWAARKVIEIPAEPAAESQLPPALKPFGAVPPLVTDIDLSVDDRFLYVSCWGTGEMRQYDVSDPFAPRLTGSVHIGGIVRRAPHGTSGPLNGGPQMVEISRDGRRVYFTNSLYRAWDEQFYPEGLRSWMTKLDVG